MSGAKAKKPKKVNTKDKNRYAKDMKIATSNLFVDVSNTPVATDINQLVLQELNSGEIIDYGDNSLFFGDGTPVTFSGNPIQSGIMKSSSLISAQYNAKTLLSNKNYQLDYRDSFAYSLEFYTPIVGTGDNGDFVYINEFNDLVINTIRVQDFQEVEIEFWSYDPGINDTIIE